jgi:isoleucyl-tRNA synthetase
VLEAEFERFFEVRNAFNRVLEEAKTGGILRKSTEAHPTLTLPTDLYALFADKQEFLREALMVPKLTLVAGSELSVTIALAPGKKCERCWFVLEDVGSDPDYPDLSARQAAIVRQLA